MSHNCRAKTMSPPPVLRNSASIPRTSDRRKSFSSFNRLAQIPVPLEEVDLPIFANDHTRAPSLRQPVRKTRLADEWQSARSHNGLWYGQRMKI
jgi:hypothetical protein